MTTSLPGTGAAASADWGGSAPEALRFPEYYQGISARRITAYLIDLAVVTGLAAAWSVVAFTLTVGSFGLLSPLNGVTVLIPIAYHSLLIGGARSATLGMRALGIEVRRWDGGRPDLLQAAIQTLLFYGTLVFTSFIVLAFALFNDRRRCLHDVLAGTVVVNRIDLAEIRFRQPANSGPGSGRGI